MNCAELKKDIERLKDCLKKTNYEERNVSGESLRHFYDKTKEAALVKDEILEKYLDVFWEKNPDLLKYHFAEELPSFGQCVYTTLLLPDGSILVGGDKKIGLLKKDKKEEWYYDNNIDLLDGDSIQTSALLSDGSVFVGGCGGALIIKKEGDEWAICQGVSESANLFIRTVTRINDDTFFVGGLGGKARILKKNREGKWYFDQEIPGFDGGISTSTLLPDGSLFVGADEGEMRILSHKKIRRFGKKPIDKWEFGEKLLCDGKTTVLVSTSVLLPDKQTVFIGTLIGEMMFLTKKADGWSLDLSDEWTSGGIKDSLLLPDNSVFLGGSNSGACFLRQNEKGEWGINETIHGALRTVSSDTLLPDGSVICHNNQDSDGRLQVAKRDTTLEGLKERLPDIAKKGKE